MLLLLTKSLPEIRRFDSPHLGRLFTPRHVNAVGATAEAGIPWAADNDAFGSFDPRRYVQMLGMIAGTPGCLFVVAPDVVGDARTTLSRFRRWEPIIHELGLPVAYVLQDGLERVGVPWDLCEAVFIGGTTEFKLSVQAERVVAEAKSRDKWVHMGRVNTTRRIRRAQAWGCDSIDGSKWVRWSRTWLPDGIAALVHEQPELI